MHTLYMQLYIESERGWGQRPDGFTLHTSLAKAKRFVEKWTKRQREMDAQFNPGGGVPETYSRVEGEPRLVEVSKKLYDACVKAKGNMWGKGNSPRMTANKIQG